jgi:hypothetical protein
VAYLFFISQLTILEGNMEILKESAEFLVEALDFGDPEMVLAAASSLQELDIQLS